MVLMTAKNHGDDASQSKSFPIGATILRDGVNFSVYSRSATGMELLLFDHVDDAAPARTLRLDPQRNRTFSYWHIFVPGVRAGQIYGFRAHGPYEPLLGMRFDPDKVLLDPYGRGVAGRRVSESAGLGRRRSTQHEPHRGGGGPAGGKPKREGGGAVGPTWRRHSAMALRYGRFTRYIGKPMIQIQRTHNVQPRGPIAAIPVRSRLS